MYALLSELLHDSLCNLQTHYNLSKIDVINQHPSYAYSSHVIYFLPHDRSYDFIFLILLSLIFIPMESSRISITPYDDTLLIVLIHSTLIPTWHQSSLPYAHLILRSPLAD